MLISVAEAIVKSLEKENVKYAFGIPGAQNLKLIDCLSQSSIKNILVTNELSAAFMADGYSRATGKAGVCIVIPGPGLTNMITGIAEAFLDSSPMVVIVTGIGNSDKMFHIHQIKQLEVVRPIVKGIIGIDDASEIARQISEAFSLAEEGEPGPVVVEIPRESLNKKIEYQEYNKIIEEKKESEMNKDKVRQIVDMLINANFCGIYAGAGAFSASSQIKQLAEIFSMAVSTTVSGKGVIPEDHELSVGFGFGPSGSKLAENIFKKCDLVLALGCRFSEMSTGSWGMQIPGDLIHIDKNPHALNKNYAAKVSLCRDVKIALEEILRLVGDRKVKKNRGLIEKIAIEKRKYFKNLEGVKPDKGIYPGHFFHQLRKFIDRDTILVTDCGNHQLWAISDFPAFEPRTFITPSDYQAMGFALPAAIGAKLGCFNRRVISVCGDAGFLISGFEILTALREKASLTLIIFNDSALGLIKGLQKNIYGRSNSVDFLSPDYETLAKAFGINYVAIRTDEELASKLEKVASEETMTLVEVKVQYDNFLPKYITGMEKILWKRLSIRQKLSIINKRIGKFFY